MNLSFGLDSFNITNIIWEKEIDRRPLKTLLLKRGYKIVKNNGLDAHVGRVVLGF